MGSPRCLRCGQPAPPGQDLHERVEDCLQATGEALAQAQGRVADLERSFDQHPEFRRRYLLEGHRCAKLATALWSTGPEGRLCRACHAAQHPERPAGFFLQRRA